MSSAGGGRARRQHDRRQHRQDFEGFHWYIACVLTENDLVRLDRTTEVTVEMPFVTVEQIPAEVVKINRDSETGEAAVILKCAYMNSELASARKETLRINISSYSGVLVPEDAIHFADVVAHETDAVGNEVDVTYETSAASTSSPAAASVSCRSSATLRSTATPSAR